MADGEPRPIVWMGQTLKDIGEMAAAVKMVFGTALRQAQNGQTHVDAKPFPDAGPGVYYVKSDDAGNTYLAFYAVRLGDAVYVLDLFQKKSVKGIATPQKDVDRIKARFRAAQEYHDARKKPQKARRG